MDFFDHNRHVIPRYSKMQSRMPSDTNMNDPKGMPLIKPGLGISFGFSGTVIENAIPVIPEVPRKAP
jgi:hypothetical protein